MSIRVVEIFWSIILKPWSKTQESWIAGGGEYFVLDVGGADIVEYSAEEGVIVRFEEDVIADRFILLVGKKLNQLEILFLINQQKLILFLSTQLMFMVIHFHQGLVLMCILSDY